MVVFSNCKYCKQTPSALRALRTASSLPWQSLDSRPPPAMPALLMPSPRRPTTWRCRRCRMHANRLPPPKTTPMPAPAHAKPVPPPSPLALASTSRGATMVQQPSFCGAVDGRLLAHELNDGPAGPPSVVCEAFRGPLVAGSDHIPCHTPRKGRNLRLVSAKVTGAGVQSYALLTTRVLHAWAASFSTYLATCNSFSIWVPPPHAVMDPNKK